MSRRKRRINLYDNINFAPLMDLLTSVVGAMLFVVIFAVISARSSQVKMVTPRLQEPPARTERKVFLCTNGTVRMFDWDGGKRKLLTGIGTIGYDEVPAMVARANTTNANDGWFRYSLTYDDWSAGGQQYRSISLIAEPIDDLQGERAEDLDTASSKLETTLGRLDKRKTWVTFLVDKNSVDVFQKARTIAVEQGYAAGWDPIVQILFPYKECVMGCPGGKEATAGIARGIQW